MAERAGCWAYVVAGISYIAGSLAFVSGDVQDAIYFTLSAIALLGFRQALDG